MLGLMEYWDLNKLDVAPRQPQILHSQRGEARSIAIELAEGDLLQELQVHERAYLIVIGGEIEIEQPNGDVISGIDGFMAVFDPAERWEVRARADSRLLLVLMPWPGEGHPGARD